MERRVLSETEIASELKKLDGWQAEDGKLIRGYKFANFAESLAFVNRVGEIAEAADHHPDAAKTYAAMRPSATLNTIVDGI